MLLAAAAAGDGEQHSLRVAGESVRKLLLSNLTASATVTLVPVMLSTDVSIRSPGAWNSIDKEILVLRVGMALVSDTD